MNSQLLAELLPLLTQYGIVAVEDLIRLIRNGAQRQGESDAEYVARRKAEIEANTAAIDAQDDQIQK